MLASQGITTSNQKYDRGNVAKLNGRHLSTKQHGYIYWDKISIIEYIALLRNVVLPSLQIEKHALLQKDEKLDTVICTIQVFIDNHLVILVDRKEELHHLTRHNYVTTITVTYTIQQKGSV